MRSIFDNLLTNAIRFTPPEGEILLTAEELKNFVQFTVRDSGRGIEADRLATILAPLYEDIRATFAVQPDGLRGQARLQPGEA